MEGDRQSDDLASGWQQIPLVDVFDVGGVAGRVIDKLHHALVADVVAPDLETYQPLGLLEQATEVQRIGALFVRLALLHFCKCSFFRDARSCGFK